MVESDPWYQGDHSLFLQKEILSIALFYLSFTTYVNSYLALLPQLGHNDPLRINLSTMVAFFGLIGMLIVTVVLPLVTAGLQEAGQDLRPAYSSAVLIFTALSALILYSATLSLI